MTSFGLPRAPDLERKEKYNFNKADLTGLKSYLNNINWSKLSNLNCQESLDYFTATLNTAFEQFVPKVKPKNSPKKQPPWMSHDCLKSTRKKYYLYKKYKKSKSNYDYQKYINSRNEVKKLIRKSVRDYEKNLCNDSKKNVKKFWKYINSKLKRTTGISNLIKPDGTTTVSDSEKANVLNNFFTSVFTKESLNDVPTLPPRNNGAYLCDLLLTREAVENKLNKLDPNKATGPDKFPNSILKNLSHELSLPLTEIFNKSLSEGYVPNLWKSAEITAIFKKGAKNQPGNYRPVSLTSILCKILESFITEQIQNYMESNNLFTNCQHGFRSHRSCVTQLLEVMNDFTNYSETKVDIDVIYLDFSKAFDTVPHQRLINKLKTYGIDGNILNWIASFLKDRQQRVRVNNSFSNFEPVLSGIPQGSILGPVLFIIFINDLPDVVSSTCKIFADDTKIYGPSSNNSIIQSDLLKLLEWSDLWQLKFNINKCHVMRYGNHNEIPPYYMDVSNTKILAQTTSEKDVGVTFTNGLKFETHVNNIVSKANQIIGLIKRSFTFMDKNMFIKLYKCMVRPHIEYANVIWHPIHKKIFNSHRKCPKKSYKNSA